MVNDEGGMVNKVSRGLKATVTAMAECADVIFCSVESCMTMPLEYSFFF